MEVDLALIEEAAVRLMGVAQKTPLQFCKRLSEQYKAKIYLKREDLQEVRSFKIRGAYNKMASLSDEEKQRGVVCASAGNHAQGVAMGCSMLKVKGAIFMPSITPSQKIDKVRKFGGDFVEIHLIGQTFDDASAAAQEFCKEHGAVYVHPFNDPLTIAGQGVVGKEVYEELNGQLGVILATIGGGGLISGISTFLKAKNSAIRVIGTEPEGAAEMYEALKQDKVITLEKIDTFVDGAAVKTAGDLTFAICKKNLEKIVKVPEGKICTSMIELYQNEGIITEPAGAVPVAALDEIADSIEGKNVVCIVSGGNNDLLRYPEILERSLIWQGRKHYFIVEFAQKPGQLHEFLDKVLGPSDDIVRFEYMKKTSKEKGPALVGIELKDKNDFQPLIERMQEIKLHYKEIKSDDMLYNYLI
jgi:threonine dehydratase